MPHERVARIFSRTAIDSPDTFGMENGAGDSRSGSRGGNSQIRYNTAFEEERKTTFTKQRGCFVTWWRGALIVVAVVGALLLVGLLVGYLAPCHRKDHKLNLDRVTAQRHTSKRQGKSRSLKDGVKPQKSKDIDASTEQSVRLPRGLKPLNYNLRLQPHLPPENFTVDGLVHIRVECEVATDTITLHKNQLEVSFVNLTGEGVAVPSITNTTFDPEKQFFVMKLDGHLEPGRQYVIALEFKGEINNQSVGLYRSSYVDSNGKRRWMAVSQMQPTDARRVFPCFDEPALKATFDVSIIRRKNVISLSNMPVWKTEPWIEDWEMDLYNSTVPMSTYLLAFIIGDVVPFEKGNFQVWSRPSAIQFAEYAQSTGPAVLAFYEDFFGVGYPLPKTDMVAVPDFLFAAMENWGLIIYEESALLYDPKRSSSEDKVFVTVVIAHELAHQWFGNLVTMKWWDDLWLNEGFATYIEYLGADAVQPEWGMNQQFLTDMYEVMETDCLTSSHPVSVKVTDPDEITELFDDISYFKGGAIIRMMEHFLGNDNFRNGLKNYLESFSFKSATQDDLWYFLNESSKGEEDVKQVMDNWTLQTGYPVITLTRSNESRISTVTQSRFLLDAENKTEEEDEEDKSSLWSIPLTYTDAVDLNWTTSTRTWLTTESKELLDMPDPDVWVIMNIQQVGYYRVNYDLNNWELLNLQLQSDHEVIHVINRGQILNDALNLARSGDLLYPLALNLTLYLYKERNFLPWQATLIAFRYVDLMLAKTPAYGMWKDYVLLLMSPLYHVLGWSESDPSEEMLTRFLRSKILKWACNYGSDECVASAKNMFEKWKKISDDNEIIPADVREVVLCTGIEYGTSKDWEFVWTRYLKEDLKTEKNILLKALACTREPWLLERYLTWALKPDSGIKLQDGSSVFSYVASNVYGRDIAYNFFRKNWIPIFNIYGSAVGGMAEIVEHVTAPLNSEYEVQELRTFLKQRTDRLGTATAALHQAVERSKANVRWMSKNFDVIGNWLESRISESL